MKRGALLGSSLTLVVGTGLVMADGHEGPPPQPGHPVIAALDVDQDGIVSAAEIADAAAALLALDTNGDGDLSGEELRPPCPERTHGRRGQRDAMRHDADGDGVVTLEEFTAHAVEVFTRIDTNGDGNIEQSEAEAATPPRGQRPRGFGRRGGPGRGR